MTCPTVRGVQGWPSLCVSTSYWVVAVSQTTHSPTSDLCLLGSGLASPFPLNFQVLSIDPISLWWWPPSKWPPRASSSWHSHPVPPHTVPEWVCVTSRLWQFWDLALKEGSFWPEAIFLSGGVMGGYVLSTITQMSMWSGTEAASQPRMSEADLPAPPMTATQANSLTAISWETWSQSHPGRQLPDPWPSEAV